MEISELLNIYNTYNNKIQDLWRLLWLTKKKWKSKWTRK